MSKSRVEQKRVEAYARVLLEGAKETGHVDRDLAQLETLSALTPEVGDMLTVLFEQGEQDALPEILACYKNILESDETTAPVTVTTAVPLDDELRKQIKDQCEKDLGTPVFLVEKVDPQILGGIIVEARNKRRDASVRAQLANIRSNLSSTFVGGDE